MKANELRLGNLAKTKDKDLLEVRGIESDNVTYYVINRDRYPLPEGWKAEPIPLTEEWLLKFGYKHFQSEHIYSEWALVIDGILKYKIFQSSYTGVETFTFPNSNKPVTLKHVHQLQNLYFALTGNELTIKEQ